MAKKPSPLPKRSRAAPAGVAARRTPASTKRNDRARAIRAVLPAGEEAFVVPRRLPRGIAGLPQEVVVLSQRARLVEATAHVVAEKGYAAATVADIIAHAKVSRATFYELYEDKEDCFLSCFVGLARALMDAFNAAIDAPGPLPKRLVAGVHEYLGRIDKDRWFARAFIAEAEGASPLIREAFDAARSELDEAIRAWFAEVRATHADVADVPDATHKLLQAGLGGYVIARVRAGTAPLEPEAATLAAFVFATLGLYGWARRAGREAAAYASPLR
ncbi:MAG TPA: TetR/AcrR family transcriptional regulator [Steroidobacteraceae bacterium]|nr:TetR/AcrR family transcriptional regulator [Steroidobacteraceae bacterium]